MNAINARSKLFRIIALHGGIARCCIADIEATYKRIGALKFKWCRFTASRETFRNNIECKAPIRARYNGRANFNTSQRTARSEYRSNARDAYWSA